MAAINNRIILRSLDEETFIFEGNAVLSVEPTESVDLISGKLAVDVAEITVEYEQGAGEDIRSLPYGTPVWHYQNNVLARKCYLKTIDRLTAKRYRLNVMSPTGLLDSQYHKGGVYLQKPFSELIDELIDDAVPYTYDTDVGNTEIFGWLPYDTKRSNLHQILFAENISILKNAAGDMHFAFNRLPAEPETIPESRIFLGGEVEYPSVASKISLSEHSYQYVDTIERVTLIDNSDKAQVNRKPFVFETAPIVVETLQTSGNLTVEECGANYAIVTGQGILTGIPYYDKVSVVEKSFNNNGGEYTAQISEATLVTGINSENVAERLISYYTSSETVNADVKLDGEKCGGVYQFTDMFGDRITAYLTKMSQKITSFVRAACEFVRGYTPETFGNNYTHWAAVEHNGWISIPEGTTIARFVIIGGGDGGSSGLRGVDDNQDLYAGSIGGEPGTAGKGGYIREVIIHNPAAGRYVCAIGEGGKGGSECESVTSRNLATAGTETTVTTPDGAVYSSNHSSSYRSTNGIRNLFTETVYAKAGKPGAKGGNGGRGSVSGNGEAGQDVEYFGVTYKGGKGGAGTKYEFKHVTQSLANGGAGGYGAQAYADGLDGGSAYSDGADLTPQSPGYKAYEITKQDRGHPPKDVAASKWRQIYSPGDGGDAGQGGAGRGGFGGTNDIFMSYTDPSDNKKVHLEGYVEQAWQEEYGFDPTEYHSANGSAGKNGAPGIVICYADQPMESYAPQYEAPVIQYDGYEEVTLTIDGATFTALQMNFSWNNVGAGSYLFQYRISRDGGYSWWGQDRSNLHYIAEEWTEVEVVSNDQSISEYVQLVHGGILVEARAIALGDNNAAESNPSDPIMEYELALIGTTYNSPNLKAFPWYENGNLYAGLFAYPAEGIGGSMRWNTVYRKTEGEDWEFLKHLFLPARDVTVDVDTSYEYKSAYLNANNYICSRFSIPASINLSEYGDLDTKLAPPAAMECAYVRDAYTVGSITQDMFEYRIGYNDNRATRLKTWHKRDDGTYGKLSTEVSLVSLHNNNSLGVVYSFSASLVISPGVTYRYCMKHTDNDGVYEDSDYSDPVEVTVPENKLATPEFTNHTLNGSLLTLEWDIIEHARAYYIGRYSGQQRTYILVKTLSASETSTTVTVSDDDLSSGKHAWYIQAFADSGYINSQARWIYVSPDEE